MNVDTPVTTGWCVNALPYNTFFSLFKVISAVSLAAEITKFHVITKSGNHLQPAKTTYNQH